MAEPALERLPAPAALRTLTWSPTARLVGWWAGSRLLVFACAALLHWLRAPHGYFHPEFRSTLAVLAAWDGRWYDQVAAHGYLLVPGHQSDPAFFPLYPILLRGGHVLGLSYAAAGILVSNAVLLVGLIVFQRLGREFLPAADAQRAAVFAAIAPLGYAFSMVYPESLVFTAMAAAGLFAVRGNWLACGVCASVATLARPQGVLVVIPIAAAAWVARRELSPRQRGTALAAVLAPAAAFASFPLYLASVLHDPLAWSKAQQAWGRSFSAGGVVHAFQQLPMRNASSHWVLREVLFFVAYLILLAVAYRAGLPHGWLVAGVLMVLLPLTTGAFISDARFGLLALPVYWGLAVLGRRRFVDLGLRALSVGLLVALTLTMPLVFP